MMLNLSSLKMDTRARLLPCGPYEASVHPLPFNFDVGALFMSIGNLRIALRPRTLNSSTGAHARHISIW